MKLFKEIDSKFVMRGSDFGIWFDLRPHLPLGCEAIRIIVIKSVDMVEIEEYKGICLPHQLYLEDIIEWTENGKHKIYFIPYFPEFKAISLFKEKSEVSHKCKWEKTIGMPFADERCVCGMIRAKVEK